MIVDFKATLNVRKTGTNIVTKLWNDIFVINVPEAHDIECGPEMYVYEGCVPFKLLRQLELKEVHFPLDFASNENESSLYILSIGRTDAYYMHRNGQKDESCWKRAHVKGGEKLGLNLTKWIQFGNDFKPKSMSVSKCAQLLMVSDEPFPSLRVYGPDAQLLHSIFLPRDIKILLHAVELSSGNFVISHQTLAVCLLSRDGSTVIRSYRPENDEQRLGGRLCIDSNDRVFVADTYNHRVILLDSSLLWKQVLISTIEQKRWRGHEDGCSISR